MWSKFYAGATFTITIISMILTKSSPLLLLNVLSDAVKSVIPILQYFEIIKMGENGGDNETFFYWLLIFILADWFSTFIAYCFDENRKEKDIYYWLGETFFGLFLVVLHTKLIQIDGMPEQLSLMWLRMIPILGAFAMVLHIIYVGVIEGKGNPILGIVAMMYASFLLVWYTILYPLLRLLAPVLLALVVLIPFVMVPFLIPFSFVGVVGAIVLLNYAKKHTDTWVDKIPRNPVIIEIRFVFALLIVFSEIWIISGHTIPFMNIFS